MQNIELLKQDKSILLLTAKQLLIDFDACGITLNFNTDIPDYATLYNDVVNCVNHLLTQNTEKLFQLFYRIDLPEHLVNEILKKINSSELLSDLIIKRILQKVVLKKQYSSS